MSEETMSEIVTEEAVAKTPVSQILESKKEVKIGKKVYVSPNQDDPIRNMLKDALEMLDDKFTADVAKKAKFEVLKIYPNISESVVARIIRTGKELKFFTGFDFIVEVSGHIFDLFPVEVQKIILYHEVLHIKAEVDEKTGLDKFSLRDHDLKDFTELVGKYGINYLNDIRDTIISDTVKTMTKDEASQDDIDKKVDRLESTTFSM